MDSMKSKGRNEVGKQTESDQIEKKFKNTFWQSTHRDEAYLFWKSN